MKMSIAKNPIILNMQSLIDGFVLFLLALCPILQHYKGLATNPSMEISIIVSVYMLLKLFCKGKLSFGPIIPLMIYAVYVSFVHGFALLPFLREMLQVVLFLSVINHCLDVNKLLKICMKIAVVATFLLIIQYFCFYLLKFHLQLVSTALLANSSEQWFELVRTGLIGVSGKAMNLYRPSSFFLEPSHFAIFCIPLVLVSLLSGERTKSQMIKTAFVSLGVVLSTSGIGIIAIVLIWALFGIFYWRNERPEVKFRLRDLFKLHSLLFLFIACLGFLVLYLYVGIFRQSINRIFMQSGGNVTAIAGRTSTGLKALQMLSGKNLFIGFGNEISVNNWNLGGFFLVLFLHGILGTILFYAFYINSLFRVKKEFFWMSFLFIGLSFFTVHTFAAYYKMYYTFIVLNGYVVSRQSACITDNPSLEKHMHFFNEGIHV